MTKALVLATPAQGGIEPDGVETRETILQRIRDGESLRSICRDKAMPARSTVHLWLANIEGFSDQYARACEIRADVYADQILEIADDASRDWVTKKNADGSTYQVFDGEHVQRARLRIDSRKWLMSKMAPKNMVIALRWAAIPMRRSGIAFRLSLSKLALPEKTGPPAAREPSGVHHRLRGEPEV